MTGFRAMLLSSAVLPALFVTQTGAQALPISQGQTRHGSEETFPTPQLQNPLHKLHQQRLNESGEKMDDEEVNEQDEDDRWKERRIQLASLSTAEELERKTICLHYQVEAGDSLSRLAQRFAITLPDLMRANDLEKAIPLAVGQWLLIPQEVQVYHVQEGETLANILSAEGFHFEEVLALNPELLAAQMQVMGGQELYLPLPAPPPPSWPSETQIPTSVTIQTAAGGILFTLEELQTMAPSLQWPVTGQITSLYGMRNGRMHYGIDIWNESGAQTDIVAAADGTVLSAGWHAGYGNIVILQHDEDWLTYYAHLSTIHVEVGAALTQGEPLGKMGKTGDSTGIHLHFEIRYQHHPLNPIHLLPLSN